jgi:hypothetical protein
MKEEKRNRYFISKSTKISQKAMTVSKGSYGFKNIYKPRGESFFKNRGMFHLSKLEER